LDISAKRGPRHSHTPNLSPGDAHLSATASVLPDSKGGIIAAIECIRDNTERKTLGECLNRVEKQEMSAGEFIRKPCILEKIGLAVRKEPDRKQAKNSVGTYDMYIKIAWLQKQQGVAA
jgi:hypothetical protein